MNIETQIKDLEKRVTTIEVRNKRVEGEKEWETSWERRIIIAILTYLIVVLFLATNDFPDPFKNAIVPTLGFLLSTLSLSVFRQIWSKIHKR